MFLFLACVRIGTVLVPLNFRLTPRELDVLVRDSDPQLLVFENSLTDQIKLLVALEGIEWTVEIETLDHFLTEPVHERTSTSTEPFAFDDSLSDRKAHKYKLVTVDAAGQSAATKELVVEATG